MGVMEYRVGQWEKAGSILLKQLQEAEAKVEQLRSGTCGHCGRDLPPDGDCYGCEADRLRTRIMAVIEKVEAEPLAVGGSKESIMLGRLQVADEIRAALAAKED